MRALFALLILLALQNARGLALADDTHGEGTAKGPPETTLAGIRLLTDQLGRLQQAYGAPLDVKGNEYSWRRPGFMLRVTIYQGPQYKNREIVQDIEVESDGTRLDKYGSTGRGLSLGDRLSKAVRLYGERNVDLKPYGLHGLRFAWESGTALQVEVNSNGRIHKMLLTLGE